MKIYKNLDITCDLSICKILDKKSISCPFFLVMSFQMMKVEPSIRRRVLEKHWFAAKFLLWKHYVAIRV